MKTEIPQEVLDGIGFLLLIANSSHDMNYAEKYERDNVEAVGRWFQKLTEELCSKDKT